MKAKKCGYCGSINSPDVRRCLRCGTNIASAVVSDDYERELVLTSDQQVIPISSNPSATPAGPLPQGANSKSAGHAGREHTAPEPAVSGALETADEHEPEMFTQKKRAMNAPSPDTGPGLHAVTTPLRAPRLLIRGSRLLSWVLLFGALATAAFAVRNFGFSANADMSVAGLLELENWDPYWAAIAAGIAAFGLVGFVMLRLGAAIFENLAAIRAELHNALQPEAPGRPAQIVTQAATAQTASTELPATDVIADVTATNEDKGGHQEPAFAFSAEQFLETDREAYGTLEPLLADDDKGDRRKEPTLGA